MILHYKMGNTSTKYAEPHHKKQENSIFFLKQMISSHKAFSITDEYDLQQKIGEGTYAVVYRGRSRRSNKTCAIKSVDKTKAKGISVILQNQFSILREVDHPNIIKIFGMYEDAKNYYIVSELVKGRELFQHFREKKKLSQKQAFHIFYQVLLAVNHLHNNGIMHRDIKLENIIYDPSSRILKVLDFGSALQFQSKQMSSYKCVGTVTYLAPEVIDKVYNHKCDNWSLGVFLYLLLTGAPPFSGKDQEQTFFKIKNQALSLEGGVWQALSKQVKNLIKGLLTKDPQKRLELSAVIADPWVLKLHHETVLSQEDQSTMLLILRRLINFGKLKLAQIQLGVLVFMINFVINIENEDAVVRCFHLIDSEGDGVITVPELVQAMVQFMDRPQKLAEIDAKEVLNKIDFNLSKDISYSEFLVAAADLERVLSDQNLERTFAMIDLDKSGKLSAFELKQNLGDQMKESAYAQLIAFFDEDKDGEISMKQFKSMMKTLLKTK